MSFEPKILILLIPIIVIALYFLLKYPEVSFALFISAYILKGGINIGYFNLTAILLVVTALGFILPLAIGKKINFTFRKADMWLLLFVIVLLVGCFFSPDSQEGFVKTIRFILIVFFPYMIARVFFKTDKQIHLLIKTIFITAVLISIFLIIISFFGEYSARRINFLNVNQIPLATLLATGLVIAVIRVASNANMIFAGRHSRLFCAILIIPLLYSIFLTGSRGPLISAILGLFCYYLVVPKKRLKITISMVVILLFVIIVWILNGDIIYSILEHIPNIGRYSLAQIGEDSFMEKRLELYSSAILLFLQNPLLGVGTGGFPWGYPHNIFLEIAAENGVFGLLLFICFLFSVIQKGFKYIILYLPKLDEYSKNIGLIILTLSVTLFIERQFSYGLDMNKDLFVFLGLVVSLPLVKSCNKEDELPKGGSNIDTTNMKNIKVMLITNIISPYRIPFFNSINEKGVVNFKVVALAEREKNRKWEYDKKEIGFDYEILPGWHSFIWGKKREVAIHINKGITKMFRRYNPDVVITSGYDSLAYWQAFLYCKLYRKKFVLWNGTTLLSAGSTTGVRGLLKRIIVKGADGHIVYGTKAKEYLEYLGADVDEIHVSTNTVDVIHLQNKVMKYRNGEDFVKERELYPKYLLLYVGQLIRRKGINQILEALNILGDLDIGLLIVGSGPEETNLKAFCKENKLQNVFFKGFQQQEILPKYYALTDIFILPSFEEVWGLVVNEALAGGLYVLSSKYAGASYDLIKEGWNGEVFDPNKVEEIVDLIKRVKKNIEEIRERRGDISQYACREFSIEQSAEEFLKAIKSI